MEKLVYTIAETAEILGISRSYAYQMAKEKKLPVIELGKRRVIYKASLERMLEKLDSSYWEESR